MRKRKGAGRVDELKNRNVHVRSRRGVKRQQRWIVMGSRGRDGVSWIHHVISLN